MATLSKKASQLASKPFLDAISKLGNCVSGDVDLLWELVEFRAQLEEQVKIYNKVVKEALEATGLFDHKRNAVDTDSMDLVTFKGFRSKMDLIHDKTIEFEFDKEVVYDKEVHKSLTPEDLFQLRGLVIRKK